MNKAYHKLILEDGTIYNMVVVRLDEHGRYLGHHPLRQEEPFVEWVGGILDCRKECV